MKGREIMQTARNREKQPLIYVAPLGAEACAPTRDASVALCRDDRQALQWKQAGWTAITSSGLSAYPGACLDAGHALALEEDPQALLAFLHPLCRSAGLSLQICVPNAGSENLLLRLMSGEAEAGDAFFAGYPSRRLFTHASLEQRMAAAGFTLSREADIAEHPAVSANSFLAAGSTLYRGLSYYHRLADDHSGSGMLCRVYEAVEVPDAPAATGTQAGAPFLSVVMRTVGNRIEAMREVLLCLAAQEDDSFELLIMVHNPKPGRLEAVQELVAEFPASLREKISIHTVRGGNRSTPLNAGFAKAQGDYIVALDDDDLIFANWVQVFHQAAQKASGAVLHSYSVGQSWSVQERDGRTLLAASSNFNSIFCHDFNWASQFQVNRCPLMTNAFPRDAFQRFPFRFDEKLNTVEDWDYLMHVACLVGVDNLDSVTAIYRLWSNAENSSSLHTGEEWADNLRYVQKKLRKVPVLVPPGALIPDTDPTDDQKADIELFGMKNGQYSTSLKRNPDQVELKNNKWFLDFHKLSSLHMRGQVRLDPSNTGHYLLRQLHITVKMTSGAQQEYTLRDVGSNGLRGKDHLLFLCDDPQLYIRLPQGELAELHATYQLAWGVSVKDVAKHFLPLTGLVIASALRRLAHAALRKLRPQPGPDAE